MLPNVWAQLDKLGVSRAGQGEEKPSDERAKAYGTGYWDDFALSRFLEGVCLRYVAYPVRMASFVQLGLVSDGASQDPDAIPDPEDPTGSAMPDAGAQAAAAFQQVFEYGPKIELDHHIVYHAREYGITCSGLMIAHSALDYEYGRLLACQGDKTAAQAQFDLALSGKPLEVNAAGRKVSVTSHGISITV